MLVLASPLLVSVTQGWGISGSGVKEIWATPRGLLLQLWRRAIGAGLDLNPSTSIFPAHVAVTAWPLMWGWAVQSKAGLLVFSSPPFPSCCPSALRGTLEHLKMAPCPQAASLAIKAPWQPAPLPPKVGLGVGDLHV